MKSGVVLHDCGTSVACSHGAWSYDPEG